MANPLDTKEELFRQLRDFIDRMPSLSTTVTKVMEVCNQPNTSPNDLNRVIALDPVLTGHVLKLINSAYYSLPNQVTSLTRAIIMLGLNTVKNLALSTAVLGTLGKEKSQCFSMDAFWTHSICVGVTAKALAAVKNIPTINREEYFVTGLLHDLGKIPLSNCFPEEYQQALDLADLQRCSLLQAEKMIFGFDHRLTGKMIGEKWQLNQSMISCLTHHHNPETVPEENRPLVATIAVANLYANIFAIGSAGDLHQEVAATDRIITTSGMPWSQISALHETVQEEIEKAQIFLQITKE
ncbi:MAG: HDOD domain-containing protein [Deltaproteobacteria bacterium]|nr:HDOD domain-containing protein [Deltaproteobacteria bacterium]